MPLGVMAPVNQRLLVVAGIVALVSLVPLALAAGDAIGLASNRPSGTCASHALIPFTASEVAAARGGLLIHFKNEGDAITGRLCLFDARGEKRIDMPIAFAAGETRDVLLETAPGVYSYREEFAQDGMMVTGGGTVDTRWCITGTEEMYDTFSLGPAGASGTIEGGGCVLPGSIALGVSGLFAAGGAALLGTFPIFLYTRIARPRVLDQSLRGRIHALVAQQPGIHAQELMRLLDAGEGQTAYHLGVLAREKMVVAVGKPWMKHWFVTGAYSPEQMRALSTLRDATRRRVYEAIVAEPGVTLRPLAARLGLSVSQASRAARELDRAGVVERKHKGRTLHLSARLALP